MCLFALCIYVCIYNIQKVYLFIFCFPKIRLNFSITSRSTIGCSDLNHYKQLHKSPPWVTEPRKLLLTCFLLTVLITQHYEVLLPFYIFSSQIQTYFILRTKAGKKHSSDEWTKCNKKATYWHGNVMWTAEWHTAPKFTKIFWNALPMNI